MKRSDLRTGMRVKFRSGKMAIVIESADGHIGIFENDEYMYIHNIDNNLLSSLRNGLGDPFDIVSVLNAAPIGGLFDFDLSCELLWERKEEESILTLDGVEYSESTIRSIIKKATGLCVSRNFRTSN